jgi:hypothetical protein
MRFLFFLSIIFSFQVSASRWESVSSSCLRLSSRYMSQHEGLRYCDNVANSCFVSFQKSLGFYATRDKCLNVAATCFSEVARKDGREAAAESCFNVSNLCFVHARKSGESISKSIQKCKDVSH